MYVLFLKLDSFGGSFGRLIDSVKFYVLIAIIVLILWLFIDWVYNWYFTEKKQG